jgi:hypothetical protein
VAGIKKAFTAAIKQEILGYHYIFTGLSIQLRQRL